MSSRGRPSSSRDASGSRDSQRTDRSSETTPDPLAGLSARHRVLYRARMQQTEGQSPSEGPSAPPPRSSAPQRPFAYPRPTQALFHRPTVSAEPRLPDVRMLPEMQRPRTPVTPTSSAGGSTVPSDPPPDLFFPPLVPAIPEVTPEGVPLPIPEDRPRFILVEQAYVYRPFEGMTLPSARVCSHDKEASSSATSAAGKKNNV